MAPSKPSNKELRAMAKRFQHSKQQTLVSSCTQNLRILSILKLLVLITTASIASYSSQLALAPVYGDIPSSLFHTKVSTSVFVAAWFAKYIPIKFPIQAKKLSPVLALYIPALQRLVFTFSGLWGPTFGPVFTEGVTFFPLLFLVVHSTAVLFNVQNIAFDMILALFSFGFFWCSESVFPGLLANHIGSSWLLTRCGFPHLYGAILALLSPSVILLGTLPALYHSATTNIMCVNTPSLNETLLASNYTLLARQESNTGYISVLESNHDNFRVMRCDHSLLGGVWQKLPPGYEQEFKEPVYAIFVTMEAVRLVDPPPKNPNPKALAIGLGIGTAVNGLISHGVETDIVELDPVVYRYAKDYFGLKLNHTPYIENAIGFVKRESLKKEKKYEFILHDVFTGGAVPASLFTLEFFKELRTLLADDGVIAINWAGDLKLPAARSIIMTVMSTFNNCRVFREDMPAKDIETAAVDLTNMVIFCVRSKKPYSFRAPIDADFLGSYARRHYLFPQYEIDITNYFRDTNAWTILDEKRIGSLVEWQRSSALEHWKVIRTVVPPAVWENY